MDDAGQGLCPEPMGGDGGQVRKLLQLAGGETLCYKGHFLPPDFCSIILDLDNL